MYDWEAEGDFPAIDPMWASIFQMSTDGGMSDDDYRETTGQLARAKAGLAPIAYIHGKPVYKEN